MPTIASPTITKDYLFALKSELIRAVIPAERLLLRCIGKATFQPVSKATPPRDGKGRPDA